MGGWEVFMNDQNNTGFLAVGISAGSEQVCSSFSDASGIRTAAPCSNRLHCWSVSCRVKVHVPHYFSSSLQNARLQDVAVVGQANWL